MLIGKFISVALVFWALTSTAGAVQFEILDKQNKPVKNVVVTLEDFKNPSGSQTLTDAKMSQSERQFAPHVLVVPRNTPVTFPNYDNIAHHVYSFSSAKTFEEKLHKGDDVTPVIFDQKGIVELGCNIHDWMLAYIYVTDSEYYGVSNDAGKVDIAVPSRGSHKVRLWHPRLNEAEVQVRELSFAENNHVIKLAYGVDSEDDFEFDEFSDY